MAFAKSSSICIISANRSKKHLGDGKKLDLEIRYSAEPELLDTGGGLLKAKPFLRGETFIVINTDALIDLNLAAVIDFHKTNNAAVTLVLRPDALADQYGSMDIDAAGRICRFLNTEASLRTGGTDPQGHVHRCADTGTDDFPLHGPRTIGEIQYHPANLSANACGGRSALWLLF